MNRPSFQATRATAFSRLDFRAKLAVFAAGTVAAVAWNDPRLSLGLMLFTLGACLWAGISRGYLWLMARLMAPFFLLLLLTHGFFNVQYVLRLTGHPRLTPLFSLPGGLPLVGGMVFSEGGILLRPQRDREEHDPCSSWSPSASSRPTPTTWWSAWSACGSPTRSRSPSPPRSGSSRSSSTRSPPSSRPSGSGVFAAEELGAVARVRTYAKVAVPVILGALFKAQQVEVVLQSRGFSGRRGRTYLHESRLDGPSVATIIACAPVCRRRPRASDLHPFG